MAELVAMGKTVGILSNSTQLATKEIDKYQKHGIVQGQHFHFLLTSGELAKSIFSREELPFKTPRKKFWIWGEPHPKYSSHQAIFAESSFAETADLNEADFIYISIPHFKGEDQTDPLLFGAEAQRLIQTGLPAICPNPDRFAHEGNPPRAVVRQGSLAEHYEKLGGKVFYIGKPSVQAYQIAMTRFPGLKPEQILMVGDTPETDIRGARSCGIASALVTQTGIMGDRISHHGFENAIRGLPATDHPDFFIERLGQS